MRLDHDPTAVPREGLLVAFEPGALPGLVAPAPGRAFAVDAGTWDPLRLRLETESGEVIAGTQRARLRAGLAFRPARPLDPGRRYRLHTRIDYNSNCFIGPAVEQTFEFITETGLRESVPAALDSLAYGLVWNARPRTYCCHTELSHCDGREPCLACWDHFAQPMLFPGVRAEPPQEESINLITELVVTDVDGTVYVNTPDNWRKHALTPVQPEIDSWFDWGPNPKRICVRASTETLRTGALTYAERCIDIDPSAVADGSSLAGVVVPPPFLRAPPSYPVLASVCVDPQAAARQFERLYAARFVTQLPAAAELLDQDSRGRALVDAGDAGSALDAAPSAVSGAAHAGCSLASPSVSESEHTWLVWPACALWLSRRRLQRS